MLKSTLSEKIRSSLSDPSRNDGRVYHSYDASLSRRYDCGIASGGVELRISEIFSDPLDPLYSAELRLIDKRGRIWATDDYLCSCGDRPEDAVATLDSLLLSASETVESLFNVAPKANAAKDDRRLIEAIFGTVETEDAAFLDLIKEAATIESARDALGARFDPVSCESADVLGFDGGRYIIELTTSDAIVGFGPSCKVADATIYQAFRLADPFDSDAVIVEDKIESGRFSIAFPASGATHARIRWIDSLVGARRCLSEMVESLDFDQVFF